MEPLAKQMETMGILVIVLLDIQELAVKYSTNVLKARVSMVQHVSKQERHTFVFVQEGFQVQIVR